MCALLAPITHPDFSSTANEGWMLCSGRRAVCDKQVQKKENKRPKIGQTEEDEEEETILQSNAQCRRECREEEEKKNIKLHTCMAMRE